MDMLIKSSVRERSVFFLPGHLSMLPVTATPPHSLKKYHSKPLSLFHLVRLIFLPSRLRYTELPFAIYNKGTGYNAYNMTIFIGDKNNPRTIRTLP